MTRLWKCSMLCLFIIASCKEAMVLPERSPEVSRLGAGMFSTQGMSVLDFETGDLSQWSGIEGGGNELKVSSQRKRGGYYALRAEINKGVIDTVGMRWRAEVRYPNVGGDNGSHDQEGWYAISTFINNGWINHPSKDIIFQFHDIPDPCESSRRPVLSMRIQGDRFVLNSRWDANACSRKNETGQGDTIVWEGPLEKGKWVDWVLHVKWSYTSTGVIELWKDGVYMQQRIGPNTYNDQKPLYFKAGVYRANWWSDKFTQRTVWIDEVRILNGLGSVQAVSPPYGDFYISTPLNNQVLSEGEDYFIRAHNYNLSQAISKVEFYLNGNLLGVDVTEPYGTHWRDLYRGDYTLLAKAYLEDNSMVTDSVLVKVNVLPQLSILEPSNDTIIYTTGDPDFRVKIKAEASDVDGSIANVEFIHDGVRIGKDPEPPYVYNLKNPATGSYNIEVVANDNSGGSVSRFVTFTVASGLPE